MGPVTDPLVLVHGFAGSAASWDAVRAAAVAEAYPEPVLPELRGHGTAADRRPITVEGCVEDILAAAPDCFGLAGYSLGGRIGLHVALAAPERVTRLVLIGSTAGIEDEEQRVERRRSDAVLADELARDGIEAFAVRWARQPLFNGDPQEVRMQQKAEVRANDPEALGAVLGALSPGVVPAVWNRLGELTMPVTIVVGERDTRYVVLAQRFKKALPDATIRIIPGAGHGLLREAPAAVASILWPPAA